MTREMMISELLKKGYNVAPKDTVKNGVLKKGIAFLSAPHSITIFHVDELLNYAEATHRSLDWAVSKVLNTYHAASYDLSDFTDPERLLDNLYIGMQKISTEPLVKRTYPELSGLESYLYIRKMQDGDNFLSAKMSKTLFDSLGMSIAEAWELAETNTFSETMIIPLESILFPEEIPNVPIDNFPPMYILSNRSHTCGASAILNRQKLSRFAEIHDIDKIVAMPSSVHEFIIMPYDSYADIDSLSQLVREVNECEVIPEERLADKAYILTVR